MIGAILLLVLYPAIAVGMFYFTLAAFAAYDGREPDEDDFPWAMLVAIFWPIAFMIPILYMLTSID